MDAALSLLVSIASLFATQLVFAGHAALRWKIAKDLGLEVARARFGWGPKLKTLRTREGVLVEIRALPPLAMVSIRGHDPAPEQPSYRELYGRADLGKRLRLTLSSPMYYVLLTLLPLFAIALLAGWPEAVTPSRVVVSEVEPESAADDAGIEPDDEIVSANGQPVRDIQDLATVVAPRAGVPTTIVLWRGGLALSVNVTPVQIGGQYRGWIGVHPKPPERIRRRLDALEAASTAVTFATTLLAQDVRSIRALFRPQREALYGPIGITKLVAEEDETDPELELVTVAITAYLVRYWLLLCLPLPFCTFGRLLLLLPEALGRTQPSLSAERWMTRLTIGAYLALIVNVTLRDAIG